MDYLQTMKIHRFNNTHLCRLFTCAPKAAIYNTDYPKQNTRGKQKADFIMVGAFRSTKRTRTKKQTSEVNAFLFF